MILGGKYELLQVIREGGVRTHRARQTLLGQIVFVHFIQESLAGEAFALLNKLQSLPEAERRQFIDAGEHDSTPYLVSWELPGFDDLASWLDRAIAKAARNDAETETGAAPPPPPTPKRKPPGEFTRLFMEGAGKEREEQPPAPSPKKAQPGEFTKMFGEAASPGPPPAKETRPGEFTEFFGGGTRQPAASVDPPSPAVEAPPPQPKVGSNPPEIVHRVVVFPSPPATRSSRPKPAKADWLDDAEPEKRPAPTQTFGSAESRTPERRSPVPSWTDDLLPRSAANPQAASPQGRPDWADDAVPAPSRARAADQVPQASAEGGGYTQVIMGRPPQAAPPVEPSTPPATPPRNPGMDPKMLLWLGLGVLGVVAIALILFFALRG